MLQGAATLMAMEIAVLQRRLLGMILVGGMMGCTPSVSSGGGADAGGGLDASLGQDAGADAATPDSGLDAGTLDGAVADAARADAGVTDAATADAASPSCGEYLDLERYLVRCEGTPYEYILHWDDLELDPDCPDYYTIGDDPTHYDTRLEATGAKQCDSTCIYQAAVAVMFLHCGYRYEYIRYGVEGCDDLYEFPEGIYNTFEEWDAENPCPDAGPDDAGSPDAAE